MGTSKFCVFGFLPDLFFLLPFFRPQQILVLNLLSQVYFSAVSMPANLYPATRSFGDDVSNHSGVRLPFFFTFFLVCFKEVVVGTENWHFVYFHDLKETATACEDEVVSIVKDARAHSGLAPKVVVVDALRSDRVQPHESSRLEIYHLAICGTPFGIDAQFICLSQIS